MQLCVESWTIDANYLLITGCKLPSYYLLYPHNTNVFGRYSEIGLSIGVSVCLPLQGQHYEVRVSVNLISVGLHSTHRVGMGLGFGISGVKKSTCAVASNKEQFDPTSPSPKNVCSC